MVAGFQGQEIGVAEAVDMVAQIKTHVNAGGTLSARSPLVALCVLLTS